MSVPVQGVLATLDGLSFESLEADETARRKIIVSAERALARLRTPYEQLWHFGFAGPTVLWVTRVLVDVGFFEGWAEAGGREATLHELWESCKNLHLDIELLRKYIDVTSLTALLLGLTWTFTYMRTSGRLLRVVVAAHVVQEVGEAVYKPTPTSLALADRKGVAVQGLLAGS